MSYARLSYDPWETTSEERKATFVGRQTLLQELLSAVGEQQGRKTTQHYLLLGPRGIGKTTLLLALREQVQADPILSKQWLCVQLREEEYFVRTLRDLLELVLQGLAEDGRLPDTSDLVQRVHNEPDDEKSRAIAVDGLRGVAEAHGKSILLLIDNFDQLFPRTPTGSRKRNRPENEYRAFRKLLSTHGFLMVIGASVRLFEEIASYDQAFFNFFCPVEIPPLSGEDICLLLKKRACVDGNETFLRRFEELKGKVRAITYMTGGNPRLVNMLYDVLRQREMLPVVQALREMVSSLTPMLKHVLDDMPRQQSKTLDALVRLSDVASPSSIAKMARLPLNVVTVQLGRLKETRFVTAEGQGKGQPASYSIADRMFRTWYQMRYLSPARRRVELFVEFLRTWFSIDERRRFLEERLTQLEACKGGRPDTSAAAAALTIEYYAASLDDERERRIQLDRLADTLYERGRADEAARLLADSAMAVAPTQASYDSTGYRILGDRLRTKGDLEKAKAAYDRSLQRNPTNTDARMGRGLCFGALGNHAAASREFDTVVTTPGLDSQTLCLALLNRGISKGFLGANKGEIADYTAVVELEGAPADQVAMALVNRGIRKGLLGNTEGAIVDYTTVVELEGAPTDQVGKALVNRGVRKGLLGDTEGAIVDYTTVVELQGAPADQVAMALRNRGCAYWSLGDPQKALDELGASLEIPDAPEENRYGALGNRGVALEHLGRFTEAQKDFSLCAESCFNAETVHGGFSGVVRISLKEGKLSDAVVWMARLHKLEPDGTPMEQCLEVRMRTILDVASSQSLDVAQALLDSALQNDPAPIRDRLGFLNPALRFARTGDSRTLDELPQEQRDAAREIAARFVEETSEKGNQSVRGESEEDRHP